MSELHQRSPAERIRLILVLGILYALTPFSIDLYLPSFPQIANDLGTTIARVALTVSTYFVGYACAQIVYGPLLDRYGRKPPLYVGLIIYILASLACLTAANVEQLMLYRAIQALGGCVAGVSGTAMVKDFFPEAETAKIFSLLMLVLSTSPLLAPTIGGFLAVTWGWKSTFAALAAMGISVLALVRFALPRGYTGNVQVKLDPFSIGSAYREILRNPGFVTYTFAGSFSFAGLFVYVAGAPAIFIDGFGVSTAAFSGIFAFLAVGMIGGGQINIQLMKRFSSEKIFRAAVAGEALVGGAFLYCVVTNSIGLYGTIAFLFAVLSCAGIAYPNAAALALRPFSQNAGSAAALLGFLQLGIGALISSMVGLSDMKGTLPSALVIVAASLTAGLILIARARKH